MQPLGYTAGASLLDQYHILPTHRSDCGADLIAIRH